MEGTIRRLPSQAFCQMAEKIQTIQQLQMTLSAVGLAAADISQMAEMDIIPKVLACMLAAAAVAAGTVATAEMGKILIGAMAAAVAAVDMARKSWPEMARILTVQFLEQVAWDMVLEAAGQ